MSGRHFGKIKSMRLHSAKRRKCVFLKSPKNIAAFRKAVLVLTILFVIGFLPADGFAEIDNTLSQKPNILILNSYHKEFKWSDELVSSAKHFLHSQISDFELYIEYMDTKRILSDEYLQLIKQTLHLKYDNVKFDVIISTDDNALQFLIKCGDNLFGQTPVVFCGVNYLGDSMLQGKTNFTGITEALEIMPNIDLILKLHLIEA